MKANAVLLSWGVIFRWSLSTTLMSSCLEIGNWLSSTVVVGNLGQREKALAAIRESVEQHRVAVQRAPKVPHYRRFFANACALHMQLALDTGHLDEAMAAALERQQLWAGNAAELYAVAADLARAAKTWPTTGPSAKDHPADLALAALRDSVAAGFRDAARLRTDAAFAALRERADFMELVAGLAVDDGGPP